MKKGEVLDWDALVSWDGSVVKSVEVDDSRVEYAAEGDYEITFTIAFDEEALNRFLEENDAAFAADGGSAVVTATVTVTGEDADREETGSSGSEPAASDQEEPSQPGENSHPGLPHLSRRIRHHPAPAAAKPAHPGRPPPYRTAAAVERTAVPAHMNTSGWTMRYGLR